MAVRGLSLGCLTLLACGALQASPSYDLNDDEGSIGVITTRAISAAGRASRLLKSERSAGSLASEELASAVSSAGATQVTTAPLTLTEFMAVSSAHPLIASADDLCIDPVLVAFCRERGVTPASLTAHPLGPTPVLNPEATLNYPGQEALPGVGAPGSPPYPGTVVPVPGQAGTTAEDPFYSHEPIVKEWAKRHGALRIRDFLLENRYRLLLALLGVYLAGLTLNLLFRSVFSGGGSGSTPRRSRRRRR